MTVDKITEYLDHWKKFTTLDKKVDTLVNELREVQRALDIHRNNFIFMNTEAGVPLDVSLTNHHWRWNGKEWPTPEKINDLLAEWHKEKKLVLKLWNEIPDKTGVYPPPQAAIKAQMDHR